MSLKEKFEELNGRMDELMGKLMLASGYGTLINMSDEDVILIKDCFKLMDEIMAWYSQAAGELDRLKSIESKIDLLLAKKNLE